MNSQAQESRRRRLEWIKNNYPEALTKNPYEDHKLISDVEFGLIKRSGLIQKTNHISGTGVINMILELQGKNPRNTQMQHRVSRTKKYVL